MQAYSIDYTIKNKEGLKSILIDAKDLKSAKRKIGKKHGYKDGRMIHIEHQYIVGYY